MTIEKNCIRVGRVDELDGKNIFVESQALANILPGSIVELDLNTPGIGLRLTGDGVVARLVVADKDELKSRSVDDEWQAGEQLRAVHFRSGDVANIRAVTGNYKVGQPMTTNLSGQLVLRASSSQTITAIVDEDVILLDNELLRVRVV